MKDLLKLFNVVVSSTILYGCEAWALRSDQQQRVRTVQCRMLRLVVNATSRQVQLEGTSQEAHDGAAGEAEGGGVRFLLELGHDCFRITACSPEGVVNHLASSPMELGQKACQR